MSLPSPSLPLPRGRRSSTASSLRWAPLGSADASNPVDVDYGSILAPAVPPSPTLREPTRSFVHLSMRGSLAPIDSMQNARHVREDTAELASYALSDASIRSLSPPRRRATQSHLEAFFSAAPPSDTNSHHALEPPMGDTIEEVSEPSSLENSQHGKSPGSSVLASMLKSSPPETNGLGYDGSRDSAKSHASEDDIDPHQRRLVITQNGVETDPSERTPLLKDDTSYAPHTDWIQENRDIERQELRRRRSWKKLRAVVAWPRDRGVDMMQTILRPKSWNRKAIWQHGVLEPAINLPSVFLGTLLNVLDALSYGMILFPLGQPIFAQLGSAGISMFYISCIVSQLVFSSGGSIFKAGVGSEMIEVVPFFHKMAYTIIASVGEENPKEVIATTITAYCMSSVLTGLVFFLLGTCGFGYITHFIPRHLLLGCIGGVGWFLIATGFEVTARLDGNLDYNMATLKKLFDRDTAPMWLIPLALSLILTSTQHLVKARLPRLERFYLPVFIMVIPIVFYSVVAAKQALNPPDLRKSGWIFEGPEAGEPWWYFYTLFDFKLVHWDALAETIPAMFALTFFGILHVPINVPALASATGVDDLSLDRELMAHGVSNVLSGFAGSIQNYLVYANSVFFIRSGATGRLAGFMLAAATGGVMIIGPSLIGWIPVMMVGTLIFVLGFELFVEAVWDPRKKLKTLEYLTVLAIVIVMGAMDFVIGIFVGIILAFISFVVQTSRISAVRGSYSGEVAGSTVRRNTTQGEYLRSVGQQIHVTKLAGYLFFGTIVSVEERIRALVEDVAFDARPIRFLIFDLWHVTGIDYSAAEAFNRINRVFSKKGITLIMSGVDSEGSIGLSLRNVGLGQDGDEVDLFSDLNSALESCENELLKTFYANKEARARHAPSGHLDVPQARGASHTFETQFSSPRRTHLNLMATTILNDSVPDSRYRNFKEPLPLILQTFQGLTTKNEDFWFDALPFFTKEHYPAGTVLFHTGESAKGFYLLESGILRADYNLPQGRYFESIVAGTTCGELPFFSETDRTATVQAERDCVTWLMDRHHWEKLQKELPHVAQELLRISLKLTSERMSAITSYVLTAG